MKENVEIRFSELKSMTNDSFEDAAIIISEAFQDNTAVFPSPPITTAILDGKVEEFAQLNSEADGPNGSENIRNSRNIVRNALFQMLYLNGIYASGIANMKETYDEKKAVLVLAGYPISNETHNPVEPVQITGLKVEVPTTPGERTINARWRRGKCEMFLVQGTQGNPSSPTTEWTQLISCRRAKCELTLAPGEWAIRIVGVYSSGESQPSDDVSFVIS